jgi:hypothetical protein
MSRIYLTWLAAADRGLPTNDCLPYHHLLWRLPAFEKVGIEPAQLPSIFEQAGERFELLRNVFGSWAERQHLPFEWPLLQ